MMKKYLLVFCFFCFLQPSLTAQQNRKVKSGSYNLVLKKLLNHTIPEITVDSLKIKMNAVTLLDAREPAEFNVSHLQNAQFIGYNNFKIDSINIADKSTPIVVYCSVGYRSGKVAEQLIAAGYTNVQNLYGGIFEWKNKGLNLYNSNGLTNNIHPFNKTWGIWVKKGNKQYVP